MLLLSVGALGCAAAAGAQVSLRSAVELALERSPRVKMAEDDVRRASAAVADARDAYIPAVALGGGIGKSYGITLGVPTIFTANAQSLIYSAAQRDYIHAAQQSLESASLTSIDVRQQVEEDVAVSYITLTELRARREATLAQGELSARLGVVMQQRADAGLEPALQVKMTQRQALELRIERHQLEVDIAAMQEHLAGLLGQPAAEIVPLPESIPALPEVIAAESTMDLAARRPQDTPLVLAADRNAMAKAAQAHADAHYAFRPQVFFQGQYGRISPIQNVSQYYNLNGNYNTFSAAVVLNLPLFDKGHAARAREVAADALHARHEAQLLRSGQAENYLRLQSSIEDLRNRAELARLDREIAEAQLQAMLIEVRTRSADATGGKQMTPRDELNARLEVQQRSLDVLAATLQWQRAEVLLLRQTGELDAWVKTPVK